MNAWFSITFVVVIIAEMKKDMISTEQEAEEWSPSMSEHISVYENATRRPYQINEWATFFHRLAVNQSATHKGKQGLKHASDSTVVNGNSFYTLEVNHGRVRSQTWL